MILLRRCKVTTIKVQEDKVLVCRFIDGKLYKVEFEVDVLARDLEDYFDISDWTFKQVARVCIININCGK